MGRVRSLIRIEGKGGHAARPHISIDSVLVGAQLITALQSIVSRNISAREAGVLSITRIQSGDAYNVIPQTAVMAGTVRTMNRDTMNLIQGKMERLTKSIAEGFGAEASLQLVVPGTRSTRAKSNTLSTAQPRAAPFSFRRRAHRSAVAFTLSRCWSDSTISGSFSNHQH